MYESTFLKKRLSKNIISILGALKMKLVLALAVCLPTLALASPVSYFGAIDSARVQNYFNSATSGIVVWHLPTNDKCGNNPSGNINFNSITLAEKNRAWSALLTATASGKPVYIEYDNVSCVATSIGIN